ncbi:MAG: hypothetical protein ISS94_05635 [Candidatus Syntrophoarchaeum sp.]|nr:hypothetical protein [Candidatus Syntrophoarchaeum sp.]
MIVLVYRGARREHREKFDSGEMGDDLDFFSWTMKYMKQMRAEDFIAALTESAEMR